MNIKKFKQMNGIKMWSASTTIPIELVEDGNYIIHVKNELKERCIKEYIKNVEDSFKYSIFTDKISRKADIVITMEDLFSLKDYNKRLRRELSELVDMYKALSNIKQ